MRLPLIPQLSTKDGISNKNARLTNTLKETAAQGDIAAVRPGLTYTATSTGDGKGLVAFNDALISVYGNDVHIGYGSQSVSYSLTANASSQISGFDYCYVLDNGYILSLTSSSIYFSTDLVTFSTVYENQDPDNFSFSKLATNGTISIVPAYDAAGWGGGGYLYIDSNLVVTEYLNPAFADSGKFEFLGGKFLYHDYAYNYTYTSIDGITWNQGIAYDSNFRPISASYLNGTYVLIGFDNLSNTHISAITSTDGLTWSAIHSIATVIANDMPCICQCGDRFLAVNSQISYHSPDGITWSGSPHGIDGLVYITNLTYNSITDVVMAIGAGTYYSFDRGLTWFFGDARPGSGGGSSIGSSFVRCGATVDYIAIVEIYSDIRLITQLDSFSTVSGDAFDFAQSTL